MNRVKSKMFIKRMILLLIDPYVLPGSSVLDMEWEKIEVGVLV